MQLTLSKERALRSADYRKMVDLLPSNITTIDQECIPLTSVKCVSGVIIINPEFYSKDYNKASDERVYIKSCCIQFSYNKHVYRVNGETHMDCKEKSCSMFDTCIDVYERGFSLSNYEFISCEDAPNFIRRYKNHIFTPTIDNYNFTCADNKIRIMQDGELELEGHIQKALLREKKHTYLLDINYYKYAKINTLVICSIQFTRKKLSLYGLTKPFSFKRRQRMCFDIN